ncbi:hypothetical protein Tco_1263236, partial [Tanacetum coccineum]
MIVSTPMTFLPVNPTEYLVSTVDGTMPLKGLILAELVSTASTSVSTGSRVSTVSSKLPTLDAFDDLDDYLAHGMDYMETEEAVNEGRQSNETEELNLDVDTKVIDKDKGSGEKGGSTVSTARPEVDTARPEVHTTNEPVITAGVTIYQT